MAEKYVDAVEAQRITIHILSALTPDAGIDIQKRWISDREELSKDAVRFLELCLSISSELRGDPGRYQRVDTVCMTILRRQKGTDKILKKEYGEALGLGKMERGRLEKGKKTLVLDQIKALCAGFRDQVTQRFWESQLLELYPDASAVGRYAAFEMDGLRWLYKSVKNSPLYPVLEQLDKLDKARLEDLFPLVPGKAPDKNRFGGQPDKLYSVIGFLSREKKIPILQVSEYVVVSNETWYAWRRKWDAAEKAEFQQGVPKTKLSPAQIMALAALFELDYPESIYLMALAGYRYHSGEPDTEVVKALRGFPEAKSSCELLSYLHTGISLGKW